MNEIREKAKRIAADEIKKAGLHPHCAGAATIHMRVLRSLLTPQTEVLTPAVAQAIMMKSEREAAHRSSPLSFISGSEIEDVQ